MPVVSVAFSGSIALIRIDNPPINATSHAVRAGLMVAMEQIAQNTTVTAAILICAGKTFIAGADINEFNQPPQAPLLPDVILRLETLKIPIIAALHGTVLGGGLEVALGCHYRIAAPDTKLGFPEVNLGLIPGAGGTVRTPRLIGPHHACTLIADGKPVGAAVAHDWGLIDQLADQDLEQAAIAFAQAAAKAPLPTALTHRPLSDKVFDWDRVLEKTRQKARGANAPVVALETIRTGLSLPAADALALERQQFLKLRDSEQSYALRHIFMAERSVGKIGTLKKITPAPLHHVGIVGGGMMGAGIATACLLAGYKVTMIERGDDALQNGTQTVTRHLQTSRDRKIISEPLYNEHLARFNGSTDYRALANCALVIEAVFEDFDIKKAVFTALENVVSPDTLIASNTSYLDLNALAASTNHPERVIGLHFFSPAHIMKLLEVVCTDHASAQNISTALAFARTLGKIAVPTGVCDGFIGNRIMSAYRKQCEYMIEDGAYPEQIDAAMTEFGFPMGLFAMQDMAGLEISWNTRKRLAPTRDPAERYVALGDYLCEQGRFGRKSGAGWFLYENANAAPVPDPIVTAMIDSESDRKGITRRPFSPAEIIKTILATMQGEGQKILDEGIAQSPDAIDVVMINGYGFPRWRGGPMFMSK
ncbi:3-hydroxyacyl-CoA dehydrogenase NAD-binding domain-containing protein [Thalassospira mesophila]|uniref:3-hydroxyacyl-CoA dehydrogenase n=1 Tax=Thalassospira mesophila TaxID=1293891 RepID=A0A1Y2KWB5_9PROT|nr:3-hydroxyacyl-CoA dehydrogenase NAD-binding domain-containing protein [Thalassospira mesophila]OSQ36405.1 3-hydroxyacyl-CoA dehydrogenase [Thalassospira mesophila]